MIRILLVEDDPTISHMLSVYMTREGFKVITVSNGSEAQGKFEDFKPDLAILDINLPGKTGFELLQAFRKNSKLPIIMLSARVGEDDKVRCLELGADDYIPKPFSVRELIARINRHLLRANTTESVLSTVLEVRGVKLIPDLYRVEYQGEEVKLTKTEYELLNHLFLHVGQVVERDTLMKEIIGYARYLSDRTIDTHIKNLRKKFEWVLEIETLRAVGYRLHP